MSQTTKSPLYHRRHRVALVAMALIVLGIVFFVLGSPMETRLVALNAHNGRFRWAGDIDNHANALSAPVAHNGRVFLSMEMEASPNDLHSPQRWKLLALDSASGKKLWEFTPDEAHFGPLATTMTRMYLPVATDNSVYISIINIHGRSWLAALDASNGTIRWIIENLWFRRGDFGGLEDLFMESVRYPGFSASNERVYTLLSNPEGQEDVISLAALNAQDGSKIWHTDVDISTDEPSGSMPVLIANEQTVMLIIGEQVNSYTAETGELQKTFSGGFVSVTGSVVYSNPDQSLNASDIGTGEQHWAYQWPEDVLTCLLFNADTQSVYIVCSFESDEGYSALIALDAQDGTERWRTPIAENLFTVLTQVPIISADKVFIVGGSVSIPAVMALDSNDGSHHWKYSIYDGIKSIAIEGEQVYVVEVSPRWRNWLAYLSPALH